VAAGIIIGAALRSGWNARHEAQTVLPFPTHAVAVYRYFCPLGRLMPI
jgi:hypothetical protein